MVRAAARAYTSRVRRIGPIVCLALLVGCVHPQPAELARTAPWATARDHGRYVAVNGLRLFAIPLNPASTYSWRKVMGPLAARYRVHAIDLPGFGFSDKPRDASYDTAWLAGAVLGYLDAERIPRAVLVGNSMGGAVATEAAIVQPERVAALVLLGAAGLPEAEAGGRPLSFRMLAWPVIGPVLRELPARGRVRTRLREAVYDPSVITDADVDAYYAPLRTAGGANAFLARLQQTTSEDRAARVRTIRAPTLVITGDTDRLVPPATARRYHELISGSELLVLEQTGHIPQEERPERVVGEITRWVEAHS